MEQTCKTTEVTALSREVELLKWQLAQTEANRQIQIALLKHIVSFLNRVKDHMEGQTKQPEPGKPSPTKLYTGSFNSADLPRSRSVLNVNKIPQYTTAKKLNTRKISNSISNENGFTDYNAFLDQSKLSLIQETDSKITEEISSLITLANSVLLNSTEYTKLSDLTSLCTCDKAKTDNDRSAQDTLSDFGIKDLSVTQCQNNFNGSLDFIEESFTFLPDFEYTTELYRTNSSPSSTSLLCGNEDDFIEAKIQKQPSPPVVKETESFNDKEGKKVIEDEGGFSLMSSFQEIGIPIEIPTINITPPTPPKNAELPKFDFDILDESEKWSEETIEIDNDIITVFWA